jgi:hypothetical protein
LLALQAEVLPYYEKDKKFPEDEIPTFDRLFKWLHENGAIFNKFKPSYFGPGYRGIMAANDI